ncbi:MAG: class I SAM-dependent methyltransferase [Chloroflexi bacterium]|nr:class I SAM-dependent methyltransferase [Chloroflexota bacterium]
MSLDKDPEGGEKRNLHRFVDFEGKRVLEIGCGEGRLTWKYAGASLRTFGLDPDLAALRIARADSPSGLRTKSKFICAGAQDLPFSSGMFDIALLAWSL